MAITNTVAFKIMDSIPRKRAPYTHLCANRAIGIGSPEMRDACVREVDKLIQNFDVDAKMRQRLGTLRTWLLSRKF